MKRAFVTAVVCSLLSLSLLSGGCTSLAGKEQDAGVDHVTIADGNADLPADRGGDRADVRPPTDSADAPPSDAGDAGGGDAGSPAMLSVNPTSKDFNMVVTQTNADADFEITNAGDQPSGIPAGTVVGGDFDQFHVNGTNCTAVLQPNDRCTITVRFTPTSTGQKNSTLQVTASPGGTQTISLTGTGVTAGALMLMPTSATFDPLLPMATSPPATFTVKNSGGSPTTTLTAMIAGTMDFKLGNDGCSGNTLDAGAMCTVTVTFKPSGPGPESATLSVSASTGGTATASLNGTGQHPASLSVTPSSFGFPDTEVTVTSARRTFNVKNNGDVAAGTTTGLSVSFGGTNPTDFDDPSSTCSGMLEAGGSCSVDVTFTPGGAGGRSGTLLVNGTPGGPGMASLTGNGLKSPSLSASPGSMDFMKVEIGVATTTKTWTITNNGDVATGAFTFTNSNPSEVVVTNNCPASGLGGGAQCTMAVAFKAAGGGARSGMLSLAGARGGTMNLSVTATGGYRVTVNVSGTGTVTSLPAGVSCGATCTAILDPGTAVTLQARTSNGSGYFFSGWSGGGCSGPFRDCAFTLNASVTTAATFSTMTNNLIFVSSAGFMPNEGSAANYDKDCNLAATAAGINDAGGASYVAVTSDAASTVKSRLGSARGWVRMDGRPFSDATLFGGDQVFNPVSFNELGQAVSPTTTIMTGAHPDGSATLNCTDFTSLMSGDTVNCGVADGGPGRWTDTGGTNCELDCSTGPYRIYCMGKTKTAAVTPTRTSGRLVWISKALFASGPPVPAVDPTCQAERPAGVTTAVALISYSNKSAASFLVPSMNYVRADGTLVGTGAELAAFGPIENGIWQNGDGTYQEGGGFAGDAFTGGAGGAGALTCSDWTTQAGSGTVGDYSRLSVSWWNFGSTSCTTPFARFYCVQTAP
jgi:hypothetical protein